MVTPQYFVHALKRLNLMHNKLPMQHRQRGFIWMVTLQDFLHRLKTSWTTLHFSIVDSGSVAKVKSGRQHNEKKHIELKATRLLVFLYLFLPYFVKISEESIRTDKTELSVLDILLSALAALSLSLFFATGKPETWKESHHERDPSVRDVFPYVGCLIIGAGNERRKGILRVP